MTEDILLRALENIKGAVETLSNSQVAHKELLEQHSHDSKKREMRMFDRVNDLAKKVALIDTKADLATAKALEAYHAANRASIDGESVDHSIFAEIGSVKVVMHEVGERLAKHSEILIQHEEERKRDAAIDARVRKKWKVLTPTLVGLAFAVLNRLTFLLTPPVASAEPPVKILSPISIEAGIK